MARPKSISKQTQNTQPGKEYKMEPEPEVIRRNYRGSGKLENKIALISGGDSGIGRAVAVHFAREGADVAIIYLNETKDAEDTKKMIENEGRECLLIPGDVGDEKFCQQAVKQTIRAMGRINILVNNAAEQHEQESVEDITEAQLEKTFRTNIFAYFFLTKAVLENMKKGDSIINTTSVTSFRGSEHLMDYSATKGAITTFTRSLSQNLAEKGIRVNAVAPGPIWTPLIPASFDAKQVSKFGKSTPMKRPGQPAEVAPAFVFLACEDASYITGQVIHVNGGEMVGS